MPVLVNLKVLLFQSIFKGNGYREPVRLQDPMPLGGMTPRQRQDWFQETIIEGMRLANRKSKLIHRVPLLANVEAEQINREAMESKLNFFKLHNKYL